MRSVLSLVVVGALFSTVVSATIGTTSLYLGHTITAAQFANVWRTWWIGDMVGDLIWAPLFLVWARPPRVRFVRHTGEGIALGTMVVLAGLVIFFTDLPHVPQAISPFYQAALLLLVLVWASLRFGQRGGATAAFGISSSPSSRPRWGTGPSCRRG